MFERYTEKARRVIFFARYEASVLGSPYIEPEHLLLALLREDTELTGSFVSTAAVAQVRQEIANLKPVKNPIPTSVDLPLSNAAKRILAYGAEESERLATKQIGPIHLVFGLLREPSKAAEILEKYGVTLAKLRDRAIQAGHVTQSVDQNREIMLDLRAKFGPLTSRLPPEIEPALRYSLTSKLDQ